MLVRGGRIFRGWALITELSPFSATHYRSVYTISPKQRRKKTALYSYRVFSTLLTFLATRLGAYLRWSLIRINKVCTVRCFEKHCFSIASELDYDIEHTHTQTAVSNTGLLQRTIKLWNVGELLFLTKFLYNYIIYCLELGFNF